MRYLRGGALHELLQRGPLDSARALRLLEQVGAALAAAHRVGVVHRDLKPANILLDPDGNAYLADFGIAKDLAQPAADLSFAGAFVGSPAYSSPEQIRAETVTAQTDIYALGVLLSELLTGRRPFQGPTPAAYIQQHLSDRLPPIAAQTGLPASIDLAIQRATAKVPGARYADVGAFLNDVRQALAAPAGPAPQAGPRRAATAAPTLALDLEERDNPYQGLRAFGEAEAANFFGREALVQQLLIRMGEASELARFLAVVGPSGSGKSSAVRAGLLPALRAGGLPGSESWYLVELVPGADPLVELTRALLGVAPSGVEADDLLPLLSADSRGLLRAARRVLPAGAAELVLVIDQFEELFTLTSGEAARAHLLDSIVTATIDERSRVRVVVTMRADFIDRPLQYVDFGELLKRRSELVLPLTPDELEQVIGGPARRAGLALEEGLATALIAEAAGQPGALPLLQHALSELFARRRGRLLTMAAHREIGGVSGALSRSADAIYVGLSPDGQAAARQLFLRLITPGEGAEDTRRRSRLAELTMGGADEAVERYAAARLLTLDHDPLSRQATVEVAHEALIRAWPRLRGWLEASREALRVQRRLARAADEWAAAGCEASYLARGARLEQFAALASGDILALDDAERDYLAASQAEDERQRAEVAARRREREAQRLAAEAALAVEQGNPVLGALLATHVLRQGYNPQADAALVKAMGAWLSWQRAPGTQSNIGRGMLSPDDATLAFPEAGNGVGIFDMASGRPLRKLAAGWCFDVAYSPDGLRIAAGNNVGVVLVWEAATGAELLRIQHPKTVSAVLFMPDGERLMSGCEDGIIRAWDAHSGAELGQLAGHGGQVNSLALSPDGGEMLSAGADGVVIAWDMATFAQLRQLRSYASEVNNARFSPDGRLVVAACSDRTVQICEAATGRLIRLFTGHADQVVTAAFSPDGALVVSASLDGTFRLWSVVSGHQLRIGYGHMCSDAFFTADAAAIVALDSEESRIVRAADAWEPRFLIGHTRGVWDPIFSPDGRLVVTASLDGSARIWDVQSGQELKRFLHPDRVTFAAPSPDWSRLLTTGTEGIVLLWDVASGERLRQLSRAMPVAGAAEAAFSPDGRLVMVKTAEGVNVWEAETGRLVQSIAEAGAFVHTVQFTPDGTGVITLNRDGHMKVWDMASSELRYHSGGAGREIIWMQAMPGGEQLLVGGAGLRLLDVATGAELRSVSPQENIWRVFVSSDGQRAITCAANGLSVWDIATGAELRRLALPNVRSMGVSPDGWVAAVTDFIGGVRLYRIDLEELLTLADGQLQRELTPEERARFSIGELAG
jgi:WD40 repeat protein